MAPLPAEPSAASPPRPKLGSDTRLLATVVAFLLGGVLALGLAGWGLLMVGYRMAVDIAVADAVPHRSAPKAEEDQDQAAAAGAFVPRESPEERRKDLALAAGDGPLPETPLAREMTEYLNSIVQRRDDTDAVRSEIDRPRFLAEAERCGIEIPDTAPLWNQLELPVPLEPVVVLHLRPAGDAEGEYRVITVSDQVEECGTRRWWVVRRPAGWKVFDCEDPSLGLRLSERHAQRAALDPAAFSESLAWIDEACREAEEWLSDSPERHRDEILSRMREQTVRLEPLPQPLREETRRRMASILSRAGLGDTLRVLGRCTNPEAHPYTAWHEARLRHREGAGLPAIPHYERYLAAVGESLEARRALAQLLWERGERSKALPHWRRVRQLAGHDDGARTYCWLCGDATDEAAFLDRLPEMSPVQLHAIGHFLRERDLDLTRTLMRACAERLPSSPAAWELIGRGHTLLGEHAEAAAAFRKGADLAPADENGPLLERYYRENVAAQRMTEAYTAAADRSAAFQMLIRLSGRKETEDRDQLVEARLQDAPNDPDALTAAASTLLQRGRNEAAERLWTLAIAAIDPKETEALNQARRGLLETRIALGEMDEILAGPADEATCAVVGDSLKRLGRWEDLEDLVPGWIERFPKGVWARVLHAEVHDRAGDLDAAAASWRAAHELGQSSDEKESYQQNWIRLAYERKRLLQDWKAVGSPRSALEAACSLLTECGETDELSRLLRDAKPVRASHPEWHAWAPRYHFDGNNHEGVMIAFDCSCSRSLQGEARRDVQELQVRSALRLGRTVQARELAVRLRDEQRSARWPLHVAIVSGDRAALETELEQVQHYGEQDGDFSITTIWDRLYSDPDTSRLLDDPGFAALRELRPPKLAAYDRDSDLESVLLFGEPQDLTPQRLRKIARWGAKLKLEWEPVDPAGLERAKTTFRLKIAEGDFLVSAGEAPSFRLASDKRIHLDRPTLERDLMAHRSWISIRPATDSLDHRAWQFGFLRGLTRMLASGPPLATVWYDRSSWLAATPLEVGKLSVRRLQADFVPSLCERIGSRMLLEFGPRVSDWSEDLSPIDSRRIYARWKTLGPAQELRATVRIGHWTGHEALPIRITAMHSRDGSWQIFGRPLRDFRARPQLKAGTPIEIGEEFLESFEVHDPAAPPATSTAD